MAVQGNRSTRRRRAPAEAEREIREAAERLLRTRPTQEVTVSRVMSETTLSRKSFYVYFRDRTELLVRLLTGIRSDADASQRAFFMPDSDPLVEGREALRALARLYAEHGELIRALNEAATHDSEAAEAWGRFIERSQEGLVARVREDVRRGRISGIDPEPTVRALMAMNRAYFFDQLVGRPDPGIDAVVDVLHEVWMRALYGRPS